MSYSFSVQAPSKDEAKAALAAQFDAVVVSQPTHAADKNAAITAASAFIDMLTDPDETQIISVSMHGSLGWNTPDPKSFTGAGVGISASLVAKPEPKAD
jgi:hypothetical protein